MTTKRRRERKKGFSSAYSGKGRRKILLFRHDTNVEAGRGKERTAQIVGFPWPAERFGGKGGGDVKGRERRKKKPDRTKFSPFSFLGLLSGRGRRAREGGEGARSL